MKRHSDLRNILTNAQTANSSERGCMIVLVTFKNDEDPININVARVVTTFYSLYPYGSYLLPFKPAFSSDLYQILIHVIPYPSVPYKI